MAGADGGGFRRRAAGDARARRQCHAHGPGRRGADDEDHQPGDRRHRLRHHGGSARPGREPPASPPTSLPAALAGGFADGKLLQLLYPQMHARAFEPPTSYARQLLKDMKAVKEFAHDLGLDAARRRAGRRAIRRPCCERLRDEGQRQHRRALRAAEEISRRTTMPASTRRTLLASALAAPALLARRADAAEFNYKFATNQPLGHPSNIRAQEAIDAIRQESQRPPRHPALPEQPARWRYRHVQPDPRRRHPVLPALRPDRADHRADRRRQRRRLRVQGLRHGLGGDGRRFRRAICASRWKAPASTPSPRSGTTDSAR